jgi:protein phosphatase
MSKPAAAPFPDAWSRQLLLGLSLDYAARECGKAVSEDFFDVACPEPDQVAARGIVLALADGVSGGNGRRAAETCVRSVLTDYYATPGSWPVAHSLERIIGALNAWLAAHNQRSQAAQSMLSTLTVAVLQSDALHVAHVGDCRLYRVRAHALECLTIDHVWPRRDMRNVLRRAVGLDRHLVVDCFSEELQAGDRLMLLSDGVWEVLGERVIQEVVFSRGAAEPVAQELVERSTAKQRAYYGRNDATAAIITLSDATRRPL